MSSHFLGSRNSVCIVVASEEKHLYNDFPTLPLCLSFIAERDVIWYEIFLWLVWVSYPSCVPSQPLAYLQPIGLCWGGGVGEITLMLFEYNSAVAKTLVCYQHHSSYKYKAQHYKGYSPWFWLAWNLNPSLHKVSQVFHPKSITLSHINYILYIVLKCFRFLG